MSEDIVVAPGIEARLRVLLEQIELIDVRYVKLHGELLDDEDKDAPVGIDLDVHAGFRLVGGEIRCRFDTVVPIHGTKKQVMAKIEVGLVLIFKGGGVQDLDREMMNVFMQQNGFFVAVPFLREAVQNMSQRLGLPPVTLGFFRRGSQRVSVTIRKMEPASPLHMPQTT